MTPERVKLIRQTWEYRPHSAMDYLRQNGRVSLPIRYGIKSPPEHDFTAGPRPYDEMALDYVHRRQYDDLMMFRIDRVVCDGIIVAETITTL